MKLTPVQSLVWKVATLIELVAITFTFATKADLRDPVIDAMLLIVVLVCAWITRLWVASSLTDERIKSFRQH